MIKTFCVLQVAAAINFLSDQIMPIGEIIDGLILIYEVLSPEEIAGRVEFL